MLPGTQGRSDGCAIGAGGRSVTPGRAIGASGIGAEAIGRVAQGRRKIAAVANQGTTHSYSEGREGSEESRETAPA